MKKSPKPTGQGKPRRAPYRKPKLRAYGSIQTITLATATVNMQPDGAGGAGKTAV